MGVRRNAAARRGTPAGVLGIGLTVASLASYARVVEPYWLRVASSTLHVARLPKRLSGATLAHLSDIHVGPVVPDAYLFSVFERVGARAPDIVTVTGDLTTWEPGVIEHARQVYQRLPRGRFATVVILGNHDYGADWSDYDVAARLTDALRDIGIDVLRNEVADVAGLQVIGMDDLWAQRFAPVSAFERSDPFRARLVLSHNPDTVDHAGWDGFSGEILAGHTHGGQVKPPFLPPPKLYVKNRRYTAGTFELSGGRTMHISRGVGHTVPIRFNCRPEVTLYELVGA